MQTVGAYLVQTFQLSIASVLKACYSSLDYDTIVVQTTTTNHWINFESLVSAILIGHVTVLLVPSLFFFFYT